MAEVTQADLLPCPFCGGDAERFTIEEEGDNFGGDVIQCMGICGASSHVEFGRKENLVSLWNTRHRTEAVKPLVEALRCAEEILGYWPEAPENGDMDTAAETVRRQCAAALRSVQS